jgi:hypothetical protein
VVLIEQRWLTEAERYLTIGLHDRCTGTASQRPLLLVALVAATRSASRAQPIPRRMIAAAPGSTPYMDAQVNMTAEDVPAVHVTPSHDQHGEAESSDNFNRDEERFSTTTRTSRSSGALRASPRPGRSRTEVEALA